MVKFTNEKSEPRNASDTNHQRSIAGYFLIYFSIALISLLSTVWPVSPWYYLLAYIPISILGGPCALITSIFCYITDVSTQANRAFRYEFLMNPIKIDMDMQNIKSILHFLSNRMARMEAAVFVGLLLGALSCSPLYNATSTSFVFSIAAISTFVGLVYVYFFVKESIQCPISDVDALVRQRKFKN